MGKQPLSFYGQSFITVGCDIFGIQIYVAKLHFVRSCTPIPTINAGITFSYIANSRLDIVLLHFDTPAGSWSLSNHEKIYHF